MADKFKKEINLTAKGASKTASDVNKIGTSAKKSEASVGNLIKKFAGFAGAAVVVKKAYDAMAKNVELALKQEKIYTDLKTTVEGVGKAWGDEEKALKQLFATQQAYTKFGDTDSAEMLNTLIELSGDYEASVANLALAQDLASTSQFNAQTAAKYMGMALAGNVEMLGRYVAELRTTNPEFAKLETQAEKTEYALKILNEKYGGKAQAQMESVTNKIERMKNYWGDYREMLGDKVTPTVGKAADAVAEFFARATETSLETTIRQLGELGASAEQLKRLQSMADVENYFSTYAENVQKVEKEYNKLGTTYDKEVLEVLGKGIIQVESATQGVNDQLKVYDELAPKTEKYNSTLTNMANMTASNVDHWKEVVTVVDENQLTVENLDKAIEILTNKSIEYGSQWKKATESGREGISEQITQNAKQIKNLNEIKNLLIKIKEDEERFNGVVKENNILTADQIELVGLLKKQYSQADTQIIKFKDDFDDLTKDEQTLLFFDELIEAMGGVSQAIDGVDIKGLVPDRMLMTDLQLFFADYGQGIDMIGSTANSLIGVWDNIIETNYNKEIAALQDSARYKKATDDQKIEMEEELQAKYAEEKKKAFIAEKAADAIQAGINTAVAVTELLANPVLAVAAGIAGAAEVAYILSQPVPAYATGGIATYPQLAMVGDSGIEGILNPRATTALGVDNINALNAGASLDSVMPTNYNNSVSSISNITNKTANKRFDVVINNVFNNPVVTDDRYIKAISDKITKQSKHELNKIMIKA